LVNKEVIAKANFKVAVDAVNSTGGIAIPKMLRALGVKEVLELNCEPTGKFAHTPEPLAQNLTDICRYVKEQGCDFGVVVDPDVDRLVFVKEDGELFGEECTLVSVADFILKHTPGSTVSNLSSTRALRDVTQKHGQQYFAAAVGEVNVVEKMKEVGAVIGGEGNGGVIYPALHHGRDALIGVALFLSHLAHKKMTASALRATLPDYYISKNRIDLPNAAAADKVFAAVKKKYAHEKLTTIDGVRVDFEADKSWVILRKSNTEPIIRVYAEAPVEVVSQAIAEEILDIANEIL
jgi:phosphomannomutase